MQNGTTRFRLDASAAVFTPSVARATKSSADTGAAPLAQMRARQPTPPLEENRFLEMKGERDELRKKYIREGILPDPLKPQQLSEAVKLLGTCTRMCSEFECHEREFQKELDRWELRTDTPPGGGARVDQRLAVKIYRRPAAGREIPLPEEIRPPEILKRTLDYLIHVLLPRTITSPNFALVQPFLWNRTRAIRQDFIVQGDQGALAIECHERIARLHILCLHARGGPGAEKWSEQQELEQLRKTLRSLIEFYEDRRQASYSTGNASVAPNEAEFRAYNLLLHLRDPETLREVELLPTSVFLADSVQIALRLRTFAQRSNNIERRGQPINEEATLNFYTAFIKEINRLPPGPGYLLACLAENCLTDLRRGAMKAMCHAYIERLPPSFAKVRRYLGLGQEYTDADAEELLAVMGIEVFVDASGTSRAKAFRGVTVLEDKPLPSAPEFSVVIEEKRADYTNAEIVDGIASYAAPLIEVNSPKFIEFNPHLPPEDGSAVPARQPRPPRPAVTSSSVPTPAFKVPPAFTAPTAAQIVQPPAAISAPVAPFTAFQPTPPAVPIVSSAITAFGAPSSAVAPKQSAPVPAFGNTTPAFAIVNKPAVTVTPATAASQAPAATFSFRQPVAAVDAPPVQTTSINLVPTPSLQAFPRTKPPSPILVRTPSQSSPSAPVVFQKALPSPVQRIGLQRSPSERTLVPPIFAASPVRRQSKEAEVQQAVVVAPVMPAGPTPEELAREERRRVRTAFLDDVQARLTRQLFDEVLDHEAKISIPVQSRVDQQVVTVAIAQDALATELERRITQSWAMDRWQTRLRRLRRDRASAKRLQYLLERASERSVNGSQFFMGSKLSASPNGGPNGTQHSVSLLGDGGPSLRTFASYDLDGDQDMEEANSANLIRASQIRNELWAKGSFLRCICSQMRDVPGGRVLKELNIHSWVTAVSLASQDPAYATSAWLRQKLGLVDGQADGLSTQQRTTVPVKRPDGFKLAVTTTETIAMTPDDKANLGLVIFELSKHVLEQDSDTARRHIDRLDLRKLNDVIFELHQTDSRLQPSLLVINWEVQGTESDLVRQLQQSISSDPRLSGLSFPARKIAVLMAGELEDINSVTDVFMATLRRAVPAIELHPLQRILALRRSLTLRDMATRIFRPLSDVLQLVTDTFRAHCKTLELKAGLEGDFTDSAAQIAFGTLTALANYGLRSLIRLSEHIVDEADLLKTLELPSVNTPAKTHQDKSAFALAFEQLETPRLRRLDGIAVLHCLLSQQQGRGERFPWRLYFSEVVLAVVTEAQDSFISCRIDLDVEAEMDKMAAQIQTWSHQLLSELHHDISRQRTARIKRDRSASGTPALVDGPPPKKVKVPENASLSNPGPESPSSQSTSLRAMLARARKLVE
ncbi:actin cytoskeleton and mitosis protein [Tilletia horrida]|nr:actin cytoskeleton and mitosis protein [Tilletia horrida]